MATYGGIFIVESNIPDFGPFKKRWVYHTLFWICYYLILALLFLVEYQIPPGMFYLNLLMLIPVQMCLVYINLYILIPRFLFSKKYLEYIVLLLLTMIFFATITIGIEKIFFQLGSVLFARDASFVFRNYFARCFEQIYLLGLTGSLKLSKDWLRNQQRMKEREKQYLETELNFLKSQIQPHFFFNTLNNLYSLTLKKSDQAPEVVLKLSDLMSYMLYESNVQKVPLLKEITYLQNYTDVEKLRFGQRLEVVFRIEGETERVAVPPMVLILFLENSFKHGVRNNLNQIRIDIQLAVDEKFLYFKVSNPLPENNEQIQNPGIGLKNVRRRLDLLYGDEYSLDTENWGKSYIVSLKIPVWQIT